mgnify:CR=1 FL=1
MAQAWLGIDKQSEKEGADAACTQTIDVAEEILHSDTNYDIAVLRLASNVEGYQPIPLLDAVDGCASQEGHTVTVAGWGATSQGGSQSDLALDVDVEVCSTHLPPPRAWTLDGGLLHMHATRISTPRGLT